jgi:hypothetical protein
MVPSIDDFRNDVGITLIYCLVHEISGSCRYSTCILLLNRLSLEKISNIPRCHTLNRDSFNL